jgi:N-ethylmaleimide reductase
MQKAINWADPIQVRNFSLKNRVIMPGLTRMRCNPKTGIPNDLLVQYYGQRAGSGLMMSEASSWSPRGIAYPGAGDIFNQEQANGWKRVTDEVHKKGGKLFLQLFHAGRVTHSGENGGYEPWAPSPIAIRGEKVYSLGGIDYPVPKEMTLEDIKTCQEEFSRSLDFAKFANFDGVELHGANGYIIDEFLRSFSNRRTDQYGGSAANRARFTLELIDLALKKFEPHQVGIKINPTNRNNDMFD